MSSPSTILHGPGSKRLPGLYAGALRLASIYLLFAAVWIFGLHKLMHTLGQTHLHEIEFIEDTAFAVCTAILIFLLVRRLTHQRVIVERALRRNERRYRSLVLATAQVSWTSAPNGQVVD